MASKKGLQALLAARRLGVRQTDGLDEKLKSAPVFEEVDEEKYRKVVEERRKQGRFVVGKSACAARFVVVVGAPEDAHSLTPLSISFLTPLPTRHAHI